MVEQDIIKVLEAHYPQLMFIVGNQGGVHPMTVFGIVTAGSERPIGSMRTQLNSSTGTYYYSQPMEYTALIGIQGRIGSGANDIAQDLKFMLNTPMMKRSFKQYGYSVLVDTSPLQPMPMYMDTDTFVRYQFNIILRTDLHKIISNESMTGVDVREKFYDTAGNLLEDTVDEIRG